MVDSGCSGLLLNLEEGKEKELAQKLKRHPYVWTVRTGRGGVAALQSPVLRISSVEDKLSRRLSSQPGRDLGRIQMRSATPAIPPVPRGLQRVTELVEEEGDCVRRQ